MHAARARPALDRLRAPAAWSYLANAWSGAALRWQQQPADAMDRADWRAEWTFGLAAGLGIGLGFGLGVGAGWAMVFGL